MARWVSFRYVVVAILALTLNGVSSSAWTAGTNNASGIEPSIQIEEFCPATVEAAAAMQVAVMGDGFTGATTATIDTVEVSVSVLSPHIAIVEVPALGEGSHDLELADGLSLASASIEAIPSDADLVFSLFSVQPCLARLVDQAVEDGLIEGLETSKNVLVKIDHAQHALVDFNAAEASAAYGALFNFVAAKTGKGLPEDLGEYLSVTAEFGVTTLSGCVMRVVMQEKPPTNLFGDLTVEKGVIDKEKTVKGFTCGFPKVPKVGKPDPLVFSAQAGTSTVGGKAFGAEFGHAEINGKRLLVYPGGVETKAVVFGQQKVMCMSGGSAGGMNLIQVKLDQGAGARNYVLDGGTPDDPKLFTQWDAKEGGEAVHYATDIPSLSFPEGEFGSTYFAGVKVTKHVGYRTALVSDGKCIGIITWGLDIEVTPIAAGDPPTFGVDKFIIGKEAFIAPDNAAFPDMLASVNAVITKKLE